MWLSGQPLCWVAAQSASRAGGPHEDLLAAIGAFTSGLISTHLASWLCVRKERTIIVNGEHGGLTADLLTGRLTYQPNRSRTPPQHGLGSQVTEGEPLRTQHQVFRDAVLGLPHDIVTLYEGAAAVAVAGALLAAAATKTGVIVRQRQPPSLPAQPSDRTAR
jgi:UDP-N-acetylglucosamine 3-dehydrogenase